MITLELSWNNFKNIYQRSITFNLQLRQNTKMTLGCHLEIFLQVFLGMFLTDYIEQRITELEGYVYNE